MKPKTSEQNLNFWTPLFGGIYVAGYNPVTIDMQGHRLDIAQNVDQVRVGSVHNIKAVSANGIHVTSSSLTINNVKGMNISAGGSFLSVGKVRGIYVAGTNQEGAYGDGKGLASLTINNADGWENAITFKSSQAQVENAIEVKKNTGTADLSISGMVDLYVGNDSDVITVSGGTSYYDINSTPTAYIGGGAIKAAMGRAGLISGGVLSINSKLQNGEMVATEGSRDVQVEGNFLVKDLQEDQGVLTLGMNTDKSYFKGTIFNENGSGEAYMLLQNGAQWTNASKGGYDYHGSSLKQFVGGNGAANTGYIYQNDSATLNLGNYSGYTTIFYEAPHRIEDTLQDMLEVLGNRQMCLARELTKVHEEYIRGTIEEVLEVAATCKGEMVIVMDGFKQDDVVFDMYTAITKVDEYIESGMRTKEAIGLVAKEMACKKNELYEAYHKR